jgi:hypothetical protein
MPLAGGAESSIDATGGSLNRQRLPGVRWTWASSESHGQRTSRIDLDPPRADLVKRHSSTRLRLFAMSPM